jgi:hypothetical protein
MTADNEDPPRFDLTTVNGLKQLEKFLDSPLAVALFPYGYLAKKLFDYMGSTSDISPEKQAEAAEKIIEAARRNGARRVKFKVDKSVGAKLKGNVKGDANIEANLGLRREDGTRGRVLAGIRTASPNARRSGFASTEASRRGHAARVRRLHRQRL